MKHRSKGKEEVYSYVARQPIFDRKLEIIGYELLYRDSYNNAFPYKTTSCITQRLYIEQHLTYNSTILKKKLGFVNFDYDDLINKLPLDFPNSMYVVEVLETCQPDKHLFNSLICLKNIGYTIALDDFSIFDMRWKAFVAIADIIKIDIQSYPLESIDNLVKKLKLDKKTLLAEKVETYHEYYLAKSMGFDFFQGYFFSKPEIIRKNKLDEAFNVNLELLQEINRNKFSVKNIEEIISKSVTLSLRMINYVNGQHSIRTKISSLSQAISYLGELGIKRFSSHVLVSYSKNNKPNFLFLNSLYRAFFMKIIAKKIHGIDVSNKAFITGILSMADALLDMSLLDIFSELHLDDDITLAILKNEGKLGELLLLVKSIENGDWEQINNLKVNNTDFSSLLLKEYFSTIAYVDEYYSSRNNR